MQKNYEMTEPDKEANYIDCGIESIHHLKLSKNIILLNLHYNQITKITHLNDLKYLRHLDLSANLITNISGLQDLQQLRTLNLSSNRIKKVEGLEKLKCLVKLNLSYNEIRDLSGFSLLKGSDYKLSSIELHGNQIKLVSQVTKNLNGLSSLRQLFLTNKIQSNPVCQVKDYWNLVLRGLPQLTVLDGHDRKGHPVVINVLADIPGLDDYIDFLTGSFYESEPFTTPKIDAVYTAYRERTQSKPGRPPNPINENEAEKETEEKEDYQTRISRLEEQLSRMTAEKTKPDSDKPDMSEKKRVQSTDSTQRRVKDPDAPTKTTQSNNEKDFPLISSKGRKGPDIDSSDSAVLEAKRKQSFNKTSKSKPSSDMTFGQLLRELDNERERRWKSEEACRRLMNHIKDIQDKSQQEQGVQSAALQATNKLREAFANERELRLKAEQKSQEFVEECENLRENCKSYEELNEQLKKKVSSLEVEVVNLTSEKSKELTHANEKVRQSEFAVNSTKRELEMCQGQISTLQSQVQQLQDLMVSREKDYQQELQRRFTLDSKELKEIIEKHVADARENANHVIQGLEEKLSDWKKKYSDIEEEFRMALRIEADRFQELQIAYQEALSESKYSKFSSSEMARKEEESKQLISELTALVKEQKTKITEMTKSKQDLQVEYKERVGTLEAHVEEARSRMLQMEMTKQENKKLLGQIQAQESIIEGLRAERRLWSEELAQQGSALAQDRGRLESKLETKNSEIETLKKQLENEIDTVKIKAKVIEDQTETIRKQREIIQEKEKEIARLQEANKRIQADAEFQLKDERDKVRDLQDKNNSLVMRKEELKEEILELQEKLENEQRNHEGLSRKWREKSEAIARLESQVLEMKKFWENKEDILIKERDEAIEKERAAKEQMRRMDQGFREQLQAVESGRDAAIVTARSAADREAREAKHRLAEVEAEMREVLMESERLKKNTQEKISRLTSALQDLTC